jgi:hypothetical protein
MSAKKTKLWRENHFMAERHVMIALAISRSTMM